MASLKKRKRGDSVRVSTNTAKRLYPNFRRNKSIMTIIKRTKIKTRIVVRTKIIRTMIIITTIRIIIIRTIIRKKKKKNLKENKNNDNYINNNKNKTKKINDKNYDNKKIKKTIIVKNLLSPRTSRISLRLTEQHHGLYQPLTHGRGGLWQSHHPSASCPGIPHDQADHFGSGHLHRHPHPQCHHYSSCSNSTMK